MTSQKGRLILGAVGAYDWSGTIAKYDTADDKDADIPTYQQVQAVLKTKTKESYLGEFQQPGASCGFRCFVAGV